MGPAALGGRFSTVEGILVAMKDQLLNADVMFSDSADLSNKKKLEEFHQKFNSILEVKQPVTLVLDDPAGNSYVQVSLLQTRVIIIVFYWFLVFNTLN